MSAPPPPFPHLRAGHCGSGALRDLLAFHGLDWGDGPLSEAVVFGLAGGLGFLYAELDATPSAYLVGRTGDLETDVAGPLGASLDVRSTDDADEGWSWVRDAVDAGRPPMVWADIGELDYLRVQMHNTRHDVVVAGYDEESVWVADNDRDELQRVSLASFARARASVAFPGPNAHTTFLYGWPSELPPPRQAVARALPIAVANMRGGGGPLAGLPGATGLGGVDAFARAYPKWRSSFGTTLDVELGALRVFIVKAGTGGAMFRSLYAGFLAETAELLSDPALLRAAGIYGELAATWVALSERAGARDHAGGLEHVEAIARLEHEGVAALAAAAG